MRNKRFGLLILMVMCMGCLMFTGCDGGGSGWFSGCTCSGFSCIGADSNDEDSDNGEISSSEI